MLDPDKRADDLGIEEDDGILLLEPRSQFDSAFLGYVERFNQRFALYSRGRVLNLLAQEAADDDDDTDPEYDPFTAAIEHYSFNILGGWVGEGTPGFLIDDE